MEKRCCYFLSLLPSFECLTSVFSVYLSSKCTWYSYLHIFKSTGQLSFLTLTALNGIRLSSSVLEALSFLGLWDTDFPSALVATYFLACFVVTCLYRYIHFRVPRAEIFTHTISIGHWSLNLVAHQSVNLKNETIVY